MKILDLSLRAIVESVSMDQQLKYINGDGLEGMPEMAVGKELRCDNSRETEFSEKEGKLGGRAPTNLYLSPYGS